MTMGGNGNGQGSMSTGSGGHQPKAPDEPVSIESATGDAARPTTAVLLIGYGGPDCLDSIEPFLRRLMGREPTPEVLEEVRRRYLTIGGCSPMLPLAHELAAGIERRLMEKELPVPVTFGMRYSQPFIGDVLRGMYAAGIRKVVTVQLSPYESEISTAAAREAVAEVLPELPDMEVVRADLLHTLPAFAGLLTAGAATAIYEIKDLDPKLMIFTAHSLPVSDVEKDDSYVAQLREVLDRVVMGLQMGEGHDLDGSDPSLPGIQAYGNLGEPQPWVFAYQSKGRKPGAWLGPDLDDVIDAAIEGGYAGVALCPIGFAVENMETKYDLDVVAADRLLQHDIECIRADLPNAEPLMVEAIADMVESLL